MARQRATAARRRRRIQVSEMAFAYLNDDPDYESYEGNPFFRFDVPSPTAAMPNLRTMWDASKAEILGSWVVERSGTRPSAWWGWDAPRWADDPYDRFTFHGTFAEPRRRLGGKGTPVFDCLNYAPSFEFGIPGRFISASDLECFGSLENRTHPGEPVEAYDKDDPPSFESQARYLWDRDLLEPEEKKVVERLGLLDQVEVVGRQDEDDELDEVTRREASKRG